MTGGRLRVLVVDDQPWTRRLLVAALSRDGRFDLLEASSASAGLAIIQNDKPDVVLLDYVLPDMNGSEVLEALRRCSACPPIVIVTTTITGDDQCVELLNRGAAAVFPKPVDLPELPDRVAAIACRGEL